jgi:hypothetical protein
MNVHIPTSKDIDGELYHLDKMITSLVDILWEKSKKFLHLKLLLLKLQHLNHLLGFMSRNMLPRFSYIYTQKQAWYKHMSIESYGSKSVDITVNSWLAGKSRLRHGSSCESPDSYPQWTDHIRPTVSHTRRASSS